MEIECFQVQEENYPSFVASIWMVGVGGGCDQTTGIVKAWNDAC